MPAVIRWSRRSRHQDPTCGLAQLRSWDTLELERDVEQCLGIRQLSKEELETLLQERAVDVLAFSPSAGKLTVAVLVEQYIFASQVVSELWVECGDGSPGPTESNCAELRRLLDTTLATAKPRVVVLTINALPLGAGVVADCGTKVRLYTPDPDHGLAPPRRAAPDFVRARKTGERPWRGFGVPYTSCSLQSAIDFLAPRCVKSAAPSVDVLWRRGAGCTLPLIDLLPDGGRLVVALGESGERNVLQEMSSLGAPRRCAQKELYPETEARCLKAGHPKRGKLFAGAVSPMTPGRGQLINGRGRCFLEAGFCECFPPWRDALCDRQEMGDSGQGGAIIATRVRPGEEEDLVGSLWNWWESFNNQLDHPILVFHEGLSPEDALRIKEASPSRVWFAHLGPLMSKPRQFHAQEIREEALACRFKFAWLLEEPAIQDFEWLMWIDTDVNFPIPFDRDLVRETSTAGAHLGYLPNNAPRPAPRALRALALLFGSGERAAAPDENFQDSTIDLSSRVLVLEIAPFRDGAVQRFAQWALDFGREAPICRWGDAALRGVQAWLLPPEKRHAWPKLAALRQDTSID
ncbi:Putative mannosyltransferase KTR2 [Durusdinium trenchii]|uniref:Mannosyltransferase KTR2 n=1 Tax=Durusdinium trenchii TaxID=1381693 RepID=A0ABP0LC59_9DINO